MNKTPHDNSVSTKGAQKFCSGSFFVCLFSIKVLDITSQQHLWGLSWPETQCSVKSKKKKKTSLQTKSFHMLEKKCFTGARLVHLYHRMITFYLQLNFNQCSHYITICTHVGKSTWLLSGGCSRPPMIDTVLLSWLHQVVTVFKLEWGRISLKIQTATSFHIKKNKTWLTVKTQNVP